MPGLLVVVVVVVLIALAILYNQRKCYWYVPTPHSVAEVKPRIHTQTMALHNPLYTGKLMMFFMSQAILLFSGCYRIAND